MTISIESNNFIYFLISVILNVVLAILSIYLNTKKRKLQKEFKLMGSSLISKISKSKNLTDKLKEAMANTKTVDIGECRRGIAELLNEAKSDLKKYFKTYFNEDIDMTL